MEGLRRIDECVELMGIDPQRAMLYAEQLLEMTWSMEEYDYGDKLSYLLWAHTQCPPPRTA